MVARHILLFITCLISLVKLQAQSINQELLIKSSNQLSRLSTVNCQIQSSKKYRSSQDFQTYSTTLFYDFSKSEFQFFRTDSIYAICVDTTFIIQKKDSLAYIYQNEIKHDILSQINYSVPEFFRAPEELASLLDHIWTSKDSVCQSTGAVCYNFQVPLHYDSVSMSFDRSEVNLRIDTLSLLPVYYSETHWIDSSFQNITLSIEYINFDTIPSTGLSKSNFLSKNVIKKHLRLNHVEKSKIKPIRVDSLFYFTISSDTVLLPEIHDNLILLDFWFNGCGMCRLAEKHLLLIQKDYGHKLRIIRLNPIDTSWNLITENMLQHGITDGFACIDKNYVQNKLSINGYPTLILLDRNNTIIYRSDGFSFSGMKELRNCIDSN